jgi:hypothetical protein
MLQDFMDSVWMGVGYDRSNGSKLPTMVLFAREAAAVAWRMSKFAVCKVAGHKIIDDSFAGLDNGNMDCHCSRCGASWDVPLY